ncbi:GSCOCT00014215001.2-RA-CDS [Cotesia congregata]|uniref:Cc_ben.6_18.6b_pseudo n=2 Tax=root TaxID=1 RepID=A0A8J2HBA5_COTCN|nr:GSCOCT00014215001.2-RA-CDS [Cotesia congregata]CAG5092556.1 cc_ben.6_18.6b_pseudo [Cotesia congregata]
MDCKSLAQLLMLEVFSESALKVCSLTGAKATCFRGTKTDVRPGLDKDERAILVRYVEIYGEKQRWCTEDHRAIINVMRNKLYSSRRKDRHRV